MAARRVRVLLTRNFEDNLHRIELFLEKAGGGVAFDQLIDDLLERVVPLLETNPGLGRPFPPEDSGSAEVQFVLERVRSRLDGRALRQVVRGDFLMLYVEAPRTVYLVAVKHSREQVFHLGR